MKNIDLNKIALNIKLQKRAKERIIQKQKGRPRMQPKKEMRIRMTEVLRAKFKRYDEATGNRGTSAIIVPLIQKLLEEEGFY